MAIGFNSMRKNEMMIPLCVALDTSYSMRTVLEDSKNRYYAAVQNLLKILERLVKDDLYAENVHLFLYTFGDQQVTSLINGVALGDINMNQLKKQLEGICCNGNTPMGAAIMKGLADMDKVKMECVRKATEYMQPVMVIVSDGEPTDSMTQAMGEIDKRIKDGKLVLLPFGIGTKGTRFSVFEQMLAAQGGEMQVLTTESDMKTYFRLIPKTIKLVSQGIKIEFASMAEFGSRRDK